MLTEMVVHDGIWVTGSLRYSCLVGSAAVLVAFLSRSAPSAYVVVFVSARAHEQHSRTAGELPALASINTITGTMKARRLRWLRTYSSTLRAFWTVLTRWLVVVSRYNTCIGGALFVGLNASPLSSEPSLRNTWYAQIVFGAFGGLRVFASAMHAHCYVAEGS